MAAIIWYPPVAPGVPEVSPFLGTLGFLLIADTTDSMGPETEAHLASFLKCAAWPPLDHIPQVSTDQSRLSGA